MSKIHLGFDNNTGAEVGFDSEHLARHLHLIGSTGSGKTTALLAIIRQILTLAYESACLFILDPMGNLSMDLLRWIANTRYCPSSVRERLLYIEPAREDIVLPFNPLISESDAHEFYQVERSIDLILRAWASQELAAMPRLRKWCFNAFLAVARLHLPIAMCQFLLQPGTREHEAIMRLLPPDIAYEWQEILRSRGNEAIRILESTQNRLNPFKRSVILRRMFGSRRNHFDVARFIQDRRIVILNLAGYRRISRHLSNTIGGLALNEILETAMNLPRSVVSPTYLLLDEFQHYVGPDIYDAIPIVRQQGVRLVLSHQSFSQLDSHEIDLTGLIWQPRNRIMFACDADDADTLAHELATLTFDPMKIKHQLKTHRQKIVGYSKEVLSAWSHTHGVGKKQETSRGTVQSGQTTETRAPDHELRPTRTTGTGRNQSEAYSSGDSEVDSDTSGSHEVNVPIHEDVEELSSVMFNSFDEERIDWGKMLRTLETGEVLAKFYNDAALHHVRVTEDPIPDSRALQVAVQELIQKNFESDLFLSADQIDREAEEIRLSLFQSPPIILPSADSNSSPPPPGPSSKSDDTRRDDSGLE